jgi:hypothetical protein
MFRMHEENYNFFKNKELLSYKESHKVRKLYSRMQHIGITYTDVCIYTKIYILLFPSMLAHIKFLFTVCGSQKVSVKRSSRHCVRCLILLHIIRLRIYLYIYIYVQVH